MADEVRFRRHWDDQAASYERRAAYVEKRFLRQARAWVGERAHGEVLEIAAGTGLTFPLYDPGVRLTVAEWSEPMLAQARAKATELGMPVRFEHADARRLPFADNSFDAVVCTYALCCIPEPELALAQAHRVLRTGGDLLLADHVISTARPAVWVQRAIERFTRSTGEHLTRRPAALLPGLRFEIVASQRGRLGIIERVHARRR